MPRDFHSRVLLIIVGFIVLAQLGTATATLVAVNRTALRLADHQLQVAHSVMQRTIDERDREFRGAMRALTADFAFHEAVASRDKAIIVSALTNQGDRVNADWVILWNVDGKIIASTDEALAKALPRGMWEATRLVRGTGYPLVTAYAKGRLLQIVTVDVRAPDTIGWVSMGFSLDDAVANQIKETAATEITLVTSSAAANPAVIASTLAGLERQSILQYAKALAAGGQTIQSLKLVDRGYLSLAYPASAEFGDGFVSIIQIPERELTAPLDSLRKDFMWWCGILTVLALLAAILSARMLAQPVRALANAARSLEVSKRGAGSEAHGGDCELANLAGAFHALALRAHYDSLTGLPNRALFSSRMSASIARATSEKSAFSVVFIDLNGFKKINDEMGHEMGDLVLRKVAQRLIRSMRPTDTVARLGGDEFVLLLEGVDHAEALKMVEHVIPVIGMPMKTPTGPIKVGMSAGIAAFPYHSRDREELLRLADSAMYQSKTRKFGPVIAKLPAADAYVGDRWSAQQENPLAAAGPATDPSDTFASGRWKDKDLATQRSKALEEN